MEQSTEVMGFEALLNSPQAEQYIREKLAPYEHDVDEYLRPWRRESAQNAQAKETELRLQAERAAAKSEQVAQFLNDLLQSVGPEVALGRDATLLREILDKTAQRLGEDLKGQPEVEAELRTTIGGVAIDLECFAVCP